MPEKENEKIEENKVENYIKEIVEESKDITGKDVEKEEEVPTITLRNGEKYVVPEFVLEDDLIFIQIFGHYLMKNPEFLDKISGVLKKTFKRSEGSLWTKEEVAELFLNTIVEGLPRFLVSYPEFLMQSISLIMKPQVNKVDEAGKPLAKEELGKLEKKWINERVGIEEVFDFIFPFLLERYWSLIYSKVLNKFINKDQVKVIKTAIEKAKQEIEKEYST